MASKAADNQPAIKKYSSSYWSSQIQLATNRHEKFVSQSKESIKVYKAQHDFTDTQRRINVWWYCVNTLLPAYYSSTPKAQVSLRKRAGGTIPELGSVILERNVQYALDEYFDFNLVGYNSALQFLLTGRATLWARYDVEFVKEAIEIALVRDPASGALIDQTGAPFDEEQEGLELLDDGSGLIIGKLTMEVKDNERAFLEVVQYDDFLTSDARNESEIEWVARRAYLDRDQATKIFGKEVAKSLSYTAFPSVIKNDMRRSYASYEGKAELYEIWCKTSKSVYWLQSNGEKSILQHGEPLIEFEGFFPCSMINQAIDPDSVIPVSDYVHVKDQILEIERITTRLAGLVQAVRTNALYDATMGPEVEQLLTGDLKFTPIKNWPSYKGRGGTANGIEYLEVGPFVAAIQVLQGAREVAMGQLFETLKVSDLLRGASDASKTATANRLESSWSSLGLIVRQNQFSKFISDAIGKLGAIIAGQFSSDVIMEVADANNLIAPLVADKSEDAGAAVEQIKEEIFKLVSDSEQLAYRIEIASDSMVALDQAQEKADGLEMMSSVGAFFDQMKGMIEQYPPLAGFTMALLQNVVRRFKGGKELDGVFQKALITITQIAEAKEQAASQQAAPPDPVMQQIQAQMQIEQMKIQTRQGEIAAEMQFKQQQFELTSFLEQQKLMLQQQELEHKNNMLQVEVMKIQATSQTELSKQEITKENNRVQSMLDLQRLELENIAVRLKESEKLMEEKRLSQEQELERIRMAMNSAQPMQEQQQQPIVINNLPPTAFGS